MIRRPPRSTHCISSAASDVYKRQAEVAAALAATREELAQTQEALRSLRDGMGGTVGEDGLAQTASQAQLSQVRVVAPLPARSRQRLLAPSN